MKLNPSSHPAKAGFHREAISPNAVGFIPSQRTDLVEKATKFCRILSLFLGLPERVFARRAKIPTLAAASQAGVALRRVCEPVFQGRALEQVDSGEYNKKKVYRKGRPSFYGTRNRNRTCNYPLGGGYYIHLTMQAYIKFCCRKSNRNLLFGIFPTQVIITYR